MQTETHNQNLIERMFKAGAHFGFSKSRRHPSVEPYLFGSKQGFDIFDLEKTSKLLSDAAQFLKEKGAEGKRVVLVGTKEEIAVLVRDAAKQAEVPYVVGRWVGGTFTNFSEIKKRVQHLLSLRTEKESGELDRKYTKKERVMIGREMDRLEQNFEGILTMEQVPHIVIVVDPRHDAIAVEEARQMGMTVVALMNSDCNARLVDKPVIVNDAHRASITLALSELLEAYTSGRATAAPKEQTAPVATTRPRR